MKSTIVRWCIKLAITLLFAVMLSRGVTGAQLAALGDYCSVPRLSAAFALGIVALLFQMVRWQELLRIQGFSPGTARVAKMFVWGNLLAFVTPGRVGEFGRAIALDPHRKADAVASVVVDKWFAVLATFFFGAVAMGLHFYFLGSCPPLRLCLCMAGFAAALPVLVFLSAHVYHARPEHGAIGKALHHVKQSLDALPRYFSAPVMLCSLCAQAALLVQTALIMSLFCIAPFCTNLVIAAEVYAFMLFLPFFIANIGLREYSFSMMFLNLGVPFARSLDAPSAALGISMVILFMNIIFPAAVGLCIMLIDKKHKSTI
ncbi:MAG: flippase-like domain-containing protein [Chitinispirillaceae bacterium]|nr:flippase-like domain-containing protein [Chitinispirillaceae bacterium]